MSVPVVWFFGTRGFGCHGMLMQAMEGTLWPTPRPFNFRQIVGHMTAAAPTEAVVIYDHASRRDKESAMNLYMRQLKQCLFISTCDEEAHLDWKRCMHAVNGLAWIQMPVPHRDVDAHRRFLLGYQGSTRAHMSPAMEIMPPQKREYLWGWSGQMFNHERLEFRGVAGDMGVSDDCYMQDTGKFHGGWPMWEFYERMTKTHIIPSPSGAVITDAYRTWEALEAGCLPVVNNRMRKDSPDFDYYKWACDGYHPMPVVDSWKEFPNLVDRYRTDPGSLLIDTNRCTSWWMQRKRKFVCDLEDDLSLLGFERDEITGESLRPWVTVIIPTSPIPGHPSTEVLEETIARIRRYPELADCEIIVMADGVREEQMHRRADYEEFKRRLLWKFNWDPFYAGCLPLFFDGHMHQAAMTREALKLVRTPLVFFVEHDTFPMGEIPFAHLASAICADSRINVIRLHIFHKVLDEHRSLYASDSTDILDLSLIKTWQWSQRPHLASTEWYRTMMDEWFAPEDRTMIEDAIHGPVIDTTLKGRDWGIYIYAPDGDMTRSGHSDARGEDPKYSMTHGGRAIA